MHRFFRIFIDRLMESISDGELHLAMEAAASAFDLSCFAYLALPQASKGNARLISNYPTQWTTHYLRSHYERLDPVIIRVLQDTEPFQWGPRGHPAPLSASQLQLLDDAAYFGIRYGFTIPIHDGRSPIAAVTFATGHRNAAFRRCVERHKHVFQLMALCFHVHAQRAILGKVVDGAALSPREIECLRWAMRGKSAWDIGMILGISQRTAAFHLNNAKLKLRVRTIQQAVARLALSTNKIS